MSELAAAPPYGPDAVLHIKPLGLTRLLDVEALEICLLLRQPSSWPPPILASPYPPPLLTRKPLLTFFGNFFVGSVESLVSSSMPMSTVLAEEAINTFHLGCHLTSTNNG